MHIDKQSQELLGQIVHSYNNYLSGAIGFTELALLDCNQDEIIERLNLSISSGREAVDFGNQILSAIGRLQVTMASTDIFQLLNRMAKDYSLSIQVSNNETAYLMRSNENWLFECLAALCRFCTALAAETQISCFLDKTGKDNSTIKLVIKPTLVELNDKQQARLFEPFYSSRHLLGTKDIGLAMVAGFIQQMDGKLNWSNEEGFVLEFPQMTSRKF